MRITNHVILAIDPGTKQLGVAVLAGPRLEYYGIKVIHDYQTARAQLSGSIRVTKRLIAEYRPDALAIEKVIVIQKSAAMLALTAEAIKAVAQAEGLTVYEYPPAAIRQSLCREGKATRQETARQIAVRFPELARFREHRTKWEQPYYARLFDAVAVGLHCLSQVNQHL